MTLLCLLLIYVRVEAQSNLIEAAKEVEDTQVVFEQPSAVAGDMGADALEFFFLSAQPVDQTFYFLEGADYKAIRPAFNSFGHLHRISSRSRLVLFEKIHKVEDSQQLEVYQPAFFLDVGQRSELFAVILPIFFEGAKGGMPLQAIDFTEEMFPYNQLTFMNTLPREILVILGEQRKILRPGQIIRSSYSIVRKGVGRVKLTLAIREENNSGKLLFNRRMLVYENERTIAIPISEPSVDDAIEILTYRDTGAEPL